MKLRGQVISAALGGALWLLGPTADATVTPDRTRVIFDAGQPSLSLTVINDDPTSPALAQAWLENEKGARTGLPLAVVPPVQRLEAGARSLVRITALPTASTLPADRESLFYFNLRGIPPRADKPNVLQLAVQTRVKLFYRPAALAVRSGSPWMTKLVLTRTDDGYRLDNPTPYYVTLVDLKAKRGRSADIAPRTLAPRSSTRMVSPALQVPVLTYIDDYGARPELTFSCHGSVCHVSQS